MAMPNLKILNFVSGMIFAALFQKFVVVDFMRGLL